MRENDYVEGLEHFLALSGEDTFDIDSILKQLPTYAGLTLSDLQSKGSGRVLDIGSGNGAKAIYLARRLHGETATMSSHKISSLALVTASLLGGQVRMLLIRKSR